MPTDTPARPSSSRESLLEQLGQVFRERGYDGATLTQLSAATSLGKASLYHHFPGGKAEMADVLLRDAIADAQRLAFAHLESPEPAAERLQRFIAGFGAYLEKCNGQCLLAVLALGNARSVHGAQIAAQFTDWQAALIRSFEQAGQKPKRAVRSAAELLNLLYGAQMTATLLGDPAHLRQTLKRIARNLSRETA